MDTQWYNSSPEVIFTTLGSRREGEFAGAATQLRTGALVVNPYDIEGVANAIYQAYSMSPNERQSRMRRLRQSVAKRDIYWWVNFFLWAATTHSLDAPWPSRQSRHSQ